MNIYSQKLEQGAKETRTFLKQSNPTSPDSAFWERLADDMDSASMVSEVDTAEKMINQLARRITDSFPITVTFAPSFEDALGAVQMKRKRK